MKVYAIRHKPSGRFMPCRMERTSRYGWTFWEPANPDNRANLGYDRNPRIFFQEASAKKALTNWLTGKFKTNHVDEDESFVEIVQPKIPRVREDMEIVPLNLSGYDFELNALVI